MWYTEDHAQTTTEKTKNSPALPYLFRVVGGHAKVNLFHVIDPTCYGKQMT